MTQAPLQDAFRFTPLAPARPARRNVVIEAGAGTGKTTAIVAEVLRLLLENEGLLPERIVLVTFTEKAAGEIADRILAALADLEQQFETRDTVQWPSDSDRPLLELAPDRREDYRRACRVQLTRADTLRSQTLHSFCQSLLRSFPIEAGLDPQFRIIDGFERTLLYGQLYDAWLDEETRTNPEQDTVREWELLLTKVGYLFQIRDVIFSLLERRDLLREKGDYDLGELGEAEPALIRAIDAVRAARIDGIDDEHAQRLFGYLQRTPPPRSGSIDAWIDYLEPIAPKIREANLPKGREHAALNEALKTLRTGDKGDSIYDRLVGHRAAVALHALTSRFADFLEREKKKLGVLDFDDLLLQAQTLLEQDIVAERVRQQYDYIFVDEFQDTDRVQARIIERLARDANGEYVEGKTIVVGDPKQSIYGFRRADPETYFRTTDALVRAGAEHRILRDNYRSDPPLLDAFNSIFTSLFPPTVHDPNVFRPAYHELHAAKSGSVPRDAHITFLGTANDGGDRHIAEAKAIAGWIGAHREGASKDLQRFAILLRRLTRVDQYLDVFDQCGIDYVLPPTRLFLDRPAPVDLLTILRAAAYPFDRGALIAAARTPYFALTDEEIAAGVLGENPGDSWTSFVEAMGRYRVIGTTASLTRLIDTIVSTSRIESVYASAADGSRSLRHLEHLRAIAFDYERRLCGSVRQFVDEIARRRGEPEEIEPSLLDESRNAVRIMSVHAAKGLEFDCVILPDLCFRPTGSEGVQLFTVEEPRSLVMTGRADSISANFRFAGVDKLKRIATAREEAESRRLFYVAATRAKSEVIFVWPPEPRKTGFFATLQSVFDIPAAWPEREGRVVCELGEARIRVAFERVGAVTGVEVDRSRLVDRALEASILEGPLEPCLIPPPDEVAALTTGDIAASRAGDRNRAGGVMLHRLLELWDGIAEPLDLLRRIAIEQGATDEAVVTARKRLEVIAKSETWQRIMRAENVGREMPLRFVDAAGVLVQKRLDRVIRENGRLIVIDYKSGAADEKRMAQDRAQVDAYCAALAAITGEECSGLVWYVDVADERAQRTEDRQVRG